MLPPVNRSPSLSLLFLLFIFALFIPCRLRKSDGLCTPTGCCDTKETCPNIALNGQCKEDDSGCQLSCGTCDVEEYGYDAYDSMLDDGKEDCSWFEKFHSSWKDFTGEYISWIITPNDVPYFPGYCLYDAEFNWDVPKHCEKLEPLNNFFNGRLTFLNVWSHMHIDTSCDTFPEFFQSVEIITGRNDGDEDNTECIVQINDMVGDRNIFDFLPNLKFVGLEDSDQITGPLICGNTIDEDKLTETQKNRINRIDQGRLLEYKRRVLTKPPISSIPPIPTQPSPDKLSNVTTTNPAASSTCFPLSIGILNWNGLLRLKPNDGFTSSGTYNRSCATVDSLDLVIPIRCNSTKELDDYFNGQLTTINVKQRISIKTACENFPKFFKFVEVINGSASNVKECILTLNTVSSAMSGKNLFDFFPELEFVGRDDSDKLTGRAICGNAVDEERLSPDQKNKLNKIDQSIAMGKADPFNTSECLPIWVIITMFIICGLILFVLLVFTIFLCIFPSLHEKYPDNKLFGAGTKLKMSLGCLPKKQKKAKRGKRKPKKGKHGKEKDTASSMSNITDLGTQESDVASSGTATSSTSFNYQ